jgi:predicted transcriptional regulator YdeE
MSEQFCQSCGMPLHGEELLGTDQEGNKVQEYCQYCYENGAFTNPNITMEEMIEQCIPFMVEEGMEEQSARTMITGFLPRLKRWSLQNGHAPDMPGPTRIVEKEELCLLGFAGRTTNAQEMTEQAIIPKLWARFYENVDSKSIVSQVEPGVTYGCYSDYVDGANGEYTILVGVRADPNHPIPEGMTAITIPAAKYAVFTTRRGSFPAVVVEAWQAIWQWSMISGNERAYTGDFELYDERCSDINNAEVDIYIALK